MSTPREKRISQRSLAERRADRWRADCAAAEERERERARLAARLVELRGDPNAAAERAAIWEALTAMRTTP